MTAPTIGSTAAALAALDAAYRAAQAEIAIGTVRTLWRYWTSLDGDNLAGTAQEWLDRSTQAVIDGQGRVADFADTYTLRVRRLMAPDAPPFTPPPPAPPNLEQIRKSLEFTGIKSTAIELGRLRAVRDAEVAGATEPGAAESADRSYEGRRQQILQDGARRAAGSAIRLVTSAGHDQLVQNVEQDRVAIGWARTTRAGSCYFCAMLASRGFVYKKDSFESSNAQFEGIGGQKVHDNCGCGLRPLYSREDPAPDRMEDLEQLWADSAAGYSGQAAINAFRKAYAASQLSQPIRE